MSLELLNFQGYGPYVWPAFIFTFLGCFLLYLKTKKEFKKQEKLFLETFTVPKLAINQNRKFRKQSIKQVALPVKTF
tara:strand:+ start:19 stop:249 length:231 start_codon:yes stop_codon:yes gene_type:complete